MQHVIVPTSEVMLLMVNPELARINAEETTMLAFIGDNLHILVGDFKGIDSGVSLEEIIRKNLS